MILPIHIIVALSSLLAATLGALMPSKAKYYLSNTLIGLTLLSGTALVIITRQPLLKSCITGLVYLAVASSLNLVAYRRLASAKAVSIKKY